MSVRTPLIICTGLLLLMAACGTNRRVVAPTTPRPARPSIAQADFAISGVTIGSSAPEVRQAFGEPERVIDNADSDFGPNQRLMYEGVDAYLIDGTVHALRCTKRGYPTPAGLQVGDSLDRVFELYDYSPMEEETGRIWYPVLGEGDTMLIVYVRDSVVVELHLFFDYT